jgi:hypothetical protein
MAGREISKSIGAIPPTATPFPWEAIQEINERLLEILVQMARSEASSVMLRPFLRDLLRQSPPEARKRAAARAYILVDLEFRNLPWWEAVKRSPEKPFAGYAGRNPLPKRSAVPLARTLLMAAREAIRADKETACVMLGIEPQVADLLSGLQITEIDRIAENQFPHMEFRWLDRPPVWRSLLLSAAKPDRIKERQFDAHYLQLLIGDMLPNTKAAGQSGRLMP